MNKIILLLMGCLLGTEALAYDADGSYYINIDLSDSWTGAVVSVDDRCTEPWMHRLGDHRSRNDIVLFSEHTVFPPRGGYCLRVSDDLSHRIFGGGLVTITPDYEDCPYGTTTPTPTVVLNQRRQRAVIGGCEARIAFPDGTPPVDVSFGGIAFDVDDGFFIGKLYAQDVFLGVFEGNQQVHRVFESPMREVVNHSVFRYRITISPQAPWRGFP